MIIHGKEDYHIGYYEDYTLILIHALASHANTDHFIIIIYVSTKMQISLQENVWDPVLSSLDAKHLKSPCQSVCCVCQLLK